MGYSSLTRLRPDCQFQGQRLVLSRRSPATAAFQAGQSLFDLAHVVLDAADISADSPQVLKNQVFNIVGHSVSPVGHQREVYHEAVAM